MTLKKWLKKIPFPITKNHAYDLQAKQVLRKTLTPTSNCIDVGCHEGEFIDLFLKYAPQGQHIGFEPLPDYFEVLQKKYPANCSFHQVALSNQTGESTFNYVISNPAYSGLQKRQYDKVGEKDTTIRVQMERLDHVLSTDRSIDFIKIDVEGGELQVLEGAKKTISTHQPIIIFEHGLGAADQYGTTPEMVFDLLTAYGMKVSLMKAWLKGNASFSKADFCEQFHRSLNYYFFAYSK